MDWEKIILAFVTGLMASLPATVPAIMSYLAARKTLASSQNNNKKITAVHSDVQSLNTEIIANTELTKQNAEATEAILRREG
jgi:hypothetical protein